MVTATFASTESVAVAVPKTTYVSTPVASAVTFCGATMSGGVVSRTVIFCAALVPILPIREDFACRTKCP